MGVEYIPEALRVAQKDIYNALRKRLTEVAQLDPDGDKSLQKWSQALRDRGYEVLYEPLTVQLSTETSFVFGLVSPWQQKVSAKLLSSVCMRLTFKL